MANGQRFQGVGIIDENAAGVARGYRAQKGAGVLGRRTVAAADLPALGTPAQVADAMMKYYRIGIGSFLIRGFDPLNDAVEFGRELIPRIKAGAATIDGMKAAE